MNMPFMIQNLVDTNVAGNISKAGQTAPGKTGVAGIFAALMGQVQNRGKKNSQMMTSAPPVALKGHALIAQLKKNLQLSGVSLDQLTADDSALDAIEKVLVEAGFTVGQVKNLLGELKANAGGNGVRVSTLFEGISRLTERAVATPKPAYLEISALPFIETLLAKFALTSEQIQSALSKAKVEGKGIDAEKLASELKLMRQGAGAKKNSIEDDEELDQIVSMMQQIGLTASITPAAPFDLESFVAALNRFAGRKSSPLESSASLRTNANIDHIKKIQALPASTSLGFLTFDRIAANFEMASGLPDGVSVDQRQSDNWDLFVRTLKPVSARNTAPSDRNTGSFFSSNTISEATLLPGVDPTAVSSSFFSENTLFQPLFRKAGLIGKGNNLKELQGVNTERVFAGNAEAVKTGLAAQTTPEQAALAAAAKRDEQSVDALIKTGKSVRKSADSSIAILSDGQANRAGTLESTRVSPFPQPAGREFPQYLLDQVSRQILRSHLANESEIQIQLKPPSLGRLKIGIEHTAEGLKVSIIAESQSARDMLLANSGDLKTALMEQGIRLEKINVETQADFNQTMANTGGNGSNGFNGRKRFSDSNRISVETAASEIDALLEPQIEANGLNLVA